MNHVVVASGIRFYREGLIELLKARDDIEIAGAASDLLDVGLAPPGADPRDVVDALGDTTVIVIALPGGAVSVIPWVEAGAAGYVAADAGVAELLEVMDSVRRGEARCSPAVAGHLFERVSRLARMVDTGPLPAGAAPEQLTPRERQVARLMAKGLSNKRISRQLGIKVATTKNHVHHVLQKLCLEGRGEVAAWHYEL
ncbi:MAG: response regulator transcription factor, partial [Gemmatimonadota bacterium]